MNVHYLLTLFGSKSWSPNTGSVNENILADSEEQDPGIFRLYIYADYAAGIMVNLTDVPFYSTSHSDDSSSHSGHLTITQYKPSATARGANLQTNCIELI